jgi:hypothetical protein
VRDDLRAYVVAHLRDPGAVLVVDETGFLKKGAKSAGVQRQYRGTAGRRENCQIGVCLTDASPRGHSFLDRARCRAAGIPAAVAFATKPALAQTLLERALDVGVPAAWVTADSIYGDVKYLRVWLEARPIGYVLAVSLQDTVVGPDWRQRRIATYLAAPPAADWARLSAGAGAKGPRDYDWVRLPLIAPLLAGWARWVLLRRSVADPTDVTAKDHLPVADLEQEYRRARALVARRQWQIVWLVAQGRSTAEVAASTGYAPTWLYQVVRRYNAGGAAGIGDRRHRNPGAARRSPRGWPSGLAARSARSAAGSTCAASTSRPRCPARAMPRPPPPRRRALRTSSSLGIAAMRVPIHNAARPRARPPQLMRRPRKRPLSQLSGATPTRAAICWRFRRPSSGSSAISVVARTGPMPGPLRSSSSSARQVGRARIWRRSSPASSARACRSPARCAATRGRRPAL